MIEIELSIPDGLNTMRIVEDVCAANGLTCALKGTLASYPNSIHWHVKQGKQKGTLEITWWEREHRLWFKVARGRTNQWISESIPILKEQLEKALR